MIGLHWALLKDNEYVYLRFVFFISKRYYASPLNKNTLLKFSESDVLYIIYSKTVFEELPKYIMKYLVTPLDKKETCIFSRKFEVMGNH